MTDTTQTPAPAAAASRITIDDVRTAIEGTDPNSTNASKVRALLGNRGSFETIQKHLATLRHELAAAAAPPVTAAAVPALPADAAQAMWAAAWTAAQVAIMVRAEKLAAERDAALLKLETLGQDLADQVQIMDTLSGQLDQAAATVAKVQADHLADVARLEAEHLETMGQLEDAKQWMDRSRRELEKAQADAAHAAQIAEAGRELMRQELARLTDQVGELKAALYRRAEVSPSPAVVTPSPAG